jgi:hypothetical protein
LLQVVSAVSDDHTCEMKDEFAREVAAEGGDSEIRSILLEVCHATRMGFVAIARVTEERWLGG